MKDLIPEYKRTLKMLQKAKEQAPDEDDAKIISEMISSTQFSLDYLKQGHHPENRRGIHRRSMHQRTTPLDPLWMQSYAAPSACGSYTTISESQRLEMEMALSRLTDQERQAYTLHKGLAFSVRQVALEMNIAKSTVQMYLGRAEQKIAAELQYSLFF